MKRLFVTGTGTGVGKTVVAAILAEALDADYWKPVQAGFEEGTDSEWVRSVLSEHLQVYPEIYKLKMPASPHIAARREGLSIDIQKIARSVPDNNRTLIIEGAGGLYVPLNDSQFVSDLIVALKTPAVLVSRNVLGSINHSLLTAIACKQKDIPVAGWIFNDNYLEYETEIVDWSGYQHIASIPFYLNPDKKFIAQQADKIRPRLVNWLC